MIDGKDVELVPKSMKNEKGFSLIEMLLSIALLGLIATVLITSLAITSKGLLIADERETAKNLAESQMEYVKEQLYINYSVLEHDVYPISTTISTPGYSVNCTAVPIDPVTHEPFNDDLGLQLITVTIKHNDKEVITLEGYKVDR